MPASVSKKPKAKAKPKREIKSSWRLVYFLTGLTFFGCIMMHIYIQFAGHLELGSLENEAKIFVTNSMAKAVELESEVVAKAAELESEVAQEVFPIVQEVFNWEKQLFNISQSQLKHLNFMSVKSDDQLSPADDGQEEKEDDKESNFEVVNSATLKDDDLDALSQKLYHRLKCPDADLVTFWKPSTINDLKYRSPYAMPEGSEPKYVTFEPDIGGWNNIRMQMELVLVFAAATGRILVLPPDQPMYLLNKGKGHEKAHNFADYFPFEYISQRIPVISMEEFMAREATQGKLKHKVYNKVHLPPGNKTVFLGTEREERLAMWAYLRNVSECPMWKCMKEFLVIPPAPGVDTTDPSRFDLTEREKYAKKLNVAAAKRTPQYYNLTYHDAKVIHFITKPEWDLRLLEHFYTFIHFQDDAMDRYYKRFVRDFVHYIDIIFCKAAIIVKKLLYEGRGKFSTMHIRRGELQYHEVKIPSAQILANVGHHIPENELIYIATDERNKSFFNDFKHRFPTLRYLDDYMELAGLQDINPNLFGMIDQVVAAKGRYFIGTWFSTFSGYITRMRGYYGHHDYTIWYGDKKHMDRFQKDELPMFPFYMREWNVSWANIDF